MEIYVDGVLITTWTSSGITTGFETVALDVSGYEVQLVGVLDDSEWLSITEVGITHLRGIRLQTSRISIKANMYQVHW